MSFRFWRRVRLFPGVTLNLSKSNVSLSVGPPGAKYTFSRRGNRATVGAPGTGLYYTVQDPAPGGAARAQRTGIRRGPVEDRLDLNFLERLFVPAPERAFVDGLLALHRGDEAGALEHLEAAPDEPDAAWLAGFLRMKHGPLETAERHLVTALAGARRLGRLYRKYELAMQLDLPITEEVTAHVQPCARGVRLGLAELHQARGDLASARVSMRALLKQAPEDPVAKLSLAELLLTEEGAGRREADRVVRLAEGVTNETLVHAALLLYKGRALSRLDFHRAALETFTIALRRRKGRPEALLRQIRYERALAYEALGKRRRAKEEFERVYAEAPAFEDVAARLGVH